LGCCFGGPACFTKKRGRHVGGPTGKTNGPPKQKGGVVTKRSGTPKAVRTSKKNWSKTSAGEPGKNKTVLWGRFSKKTAGTPGESPGGVGGWRGSGRQSELDYGVVAEWEEEGTRKKKQEGTSWKTSQTVGAVEVSYKNPKNERKGRVMSLKTPLDGPDWIRLGKWQPGFLKDHGQTKRVAGGEGGGGGGGGVSVGARRGEWNCRHSSRGGEEKMGVNYLGGGIETARE